MTINISILAGSSRTSETSMVRCWEPSILSQGYDTQLSINVLYPSRARCPSPLCACRVVRSSGSSTGRRPSAGLPLVRRGILRGRYTPQAGYDGREGGE